MRLTKDGKAYVIDPCCRLGAPPKEMMLEMVTNLADIIWNGAEGVIVEPIFAAKWAAELLLISGLGDENWLPVDFPPSIRDRVKLRYACRIGGKYYCVPQASHHPEIGAVVGLATPWEDAIADVTELADKVKGFYLETSRKASKRRRSKSRSSKNSGLEFDPLPQYPRR